MTIRVYEAAQGRDGVGSESITITFICIGTDDELQAWDATREHISTANADLTTYDGFNLQSLQVEERIAPNAFRLQATYAPESGKPKGQEMSEINGGEWSFSFDGGGTTAIRSRSLATVGAYGQTRTVPNARDATTQDNGGLIDHDWFTGETKGIEVPIPSLNINLTMQLPHSSITPTWINQVSDLVGCVNDRRVGAWNKGELLLLQPQGSQSSAGEVSVTYNFSLSRKRTIAEREVYGANTLAGAAHPARVIPEIEVPPHHAVWYLITHPLMVTATNKKQRFPVAAYVEQVYPYADFRILGI